MNHLNSQTNKLKSVQQNESSHIKPRKSLNMDIQIGGWKRSSKIKTSPSATFGKSQRNSLQKSDGPGPGCYNIDLPVSDQNMVSIKGSRMIRSNTDTPGPAQYNPTSMFQSKKYSFPRSSKSIINEVRPSPSAYNIYSPDKPKAITFSRQKRKSLVDESKVTLPGPGKYLMEQKQSQNMCSFPKSKKFMEEERQFQGKKFIPGPGDYQISKNRHKMKSYKFTQALKTLITRQKTPGPGSYDGQLSMLSRNGGIISRQKRQNDYESKTPGPGNYRDVSVDYFKHRQPRAIFSRAHEKVSRVATEMGPGEYYKDEHGDRILGGVISRDRRNSNTTGIAPSPLDYFPKFEEILSKSINVVFGKEQRSIKLKSQTPGPGNYDTEKYAKGLFGNPSTRVNRTELSRKPSKPGRSVNATALSNK